MPHVLPIEVDYWCDMRSWWRVNMAKRLFSPGEFTIEEFLEKLGSGRVNAQPDFQRFYIWDGRKERSFIDSLLRGYAIPPLWLWARTSKGRTTYDVIDGQQRLTCIQRFRSNQFSFSPADSPVDDSLTPLAGHYFDRPQGKALPDELRNQFLGYPIPVIKVETNERLVVIDIFKRLNQSSTTLEPQELRNAFYQGDFKKLVYDLTAKLQRHRYWGDRIFERDTIDRMGDQHHLSQLMVAMIEGKPLDKSDMVDHYYEVFDGRCRQKNMWQARFLANLEVIKKALPNKSRFTNNKADFYALFLIVDFYRRKYPHSMTDGRIIGAVGDALDSFDSDYTEFLDRRKSDPDLFPLMERYRETVVGRQREEEPRAERMKILRGLLDPIVVRPVDKQRMFTTEQRRYIWERSEDKLCCRCKKPVVDSDYEPDHFPTSWAKGGRTNIGNGAVAHIACNREHGGAGK